MRAVALTLSITLLGCFPHSARNRTFAKLGEGGAIVAGITLEAIINSGADCDQMGAVVMPNSACHDKATVLGDVGVGLILAGLLGFVATVSTAEDDKETPPASVEIKANTTDEKPAVKLPPGVKGNPAPTPAPAPSETTQASGSSPTHAAP
jgi:hypothetical protein